METDKKRLYQVDEYPNSVFGMMLGKAKRRFLPLDAEERFTHLMNIVVTDRMRDIFVERNKNGKRFKQIGVESNASRQAVDDLYCRALDKLITKQGIQTVKNAVISFTEQPVTRNTSFLELIFRDTYRQADEEKMKLAHHMYAALRFKDIIFVRDIQRTHCTRFEFTASMMHFRKVEKDYLLQLLAKNGFKENDIFEKRKYVKGQKGYGESTWGKTFIKAFAPSLDTDDMQREATVAIKHMLSSMLSMYDVCKIIDTCSTETANDVRSLYEGTQLYEMLTSDSMRKAYTTILWTDANKMLVSHDTSAWILVNPLIVKQSKAGEEGKSSAHMWKLLARNPEMTLGDVIDKYDTFMTTKSVGESTLTAIASRLATLGFDGVRKKAS